MPLKKQTLLLLGGFAFMGVALGINESIFHNFLKDAYSIEADARGALEFPRELPGLLVVLFSGVLCMLPVARVGVVGGLVFAAGMAGLGLWGGHNYTAMMATMVLGSAGMHLLQPVSSSMAIALSKEGARGRGLGRMGAVGTVGTVLGAGLVMLFFGDSSHLSLPHLTEYRRWFLVAAGAGALSALFYGAMHVPDLHQPRARIVLRRRYSLYYLLEFLFGARKQIFITFGPWVLIQVYGREAPGIAALLMIGSLIGIGFKPFAGWTIDRFGERTMLIMDGLLLSVICLGYGYAWHLSGDPGIAGLIASCCFVLDNLLFAFGTGRTVYASRLSGSHGETNSTLAMGISINHIASMVVPLFAGFVWMAWGYELVFAGAAVLALIIAAVSARVPGKAHWEEARKEAG